MAIPMFSIMREALQTGTGSGDLFPPNCRYPESVDLNTEK
jgi:hypothetical protein